MELLNILKTLADTTPMSWGGFIQNKLTNTAFLLTGCESIGENKYHVKLVPWSFLNSDQKEEVLPKTFGEYDIEIDSKNAMYLNHYNIDGWEPSARVIRAVDKDHNPLQDNGECYENLLKGCIATLWDPLTDETFRLVAGNIQPTRDAATGLSDFKRATTLTNRFDGAHVLTGENGSGYLNNGELWALVTSLIFVKE